MEKRLGKGLGALISETTNVTGKSNEKVKTVSLKDIVPNPFQPRKNFDEDKMAELINSIKEKGVIQPILVREKDDNYELIAGERRFKAAKELKIDEMPVIIRKDVTDADSLEISLIENIQREELNPVEEALAYQQLINDFRYTLEKVGQMMGKDKTTISNSLRLLTLSKKIQSYLEKGKISTGHAKAILSVLSEQKRNRLADTIIKHGLSVRQAEALTKSSLSRKKKKDENKDPEVQSIEEELQHKLGTKVSIKQGKKRGRIEIQFFSEKDLQRLISLLIG